MTLFPTNQMSRVTTLQQSDEIESCSYQERSTSICLVCFSGINPFFVDSYAHLQYSSVTLVESCQHPELDNVTCMRVSLNNQLKVRSLVKMFKHLMTKNPSFHLLKVQEEEHCIITGSRESNIKIHKLFVCMEQARRYYAAGSSYCCKQFFNQVAEEAISREVAQRQQKLLDELKVYIKEKTDEIKQQEEKLAARERELKIREADETVRDETFKQRETLLTDCLKKREELLTEREAEIKRLEDRLISRERELKQRELKFAASKNGTNHENKRKRPRKKFSMFCVSKINADLLLGEMKEYVDNLTAALFSWNYVGTLYTIKQIKSDKRFLKDEEGFQTSDIKDDTPESARTLFKRLVLYYHPDKQDPSLGEGWLYFAETMTKYINEMRKYDFCPCSKSLVSKLFPIW